MFVEVDSLHVERIRLSGLLLSSYYRFGTILLAPENLIGPIYVVVFYYLYRKLHGMYFTRPLMLHTITLPIFMYSWMCIVLGMEM
jgi:hypothetical protein